MAKIYLAIPSTSGNVERLFSIAGAIARARRASIKTDTLEKLLCCRQYFRNSENTSDIEAPDLDPSNDPNPEPPKSDPSEEMHSSCKDSDEDSDIEDVE